MGLLNYTTDEINVLLEKISEDTVISGSNPNGYYVKFLDGTMICYTSAVDINGLSVASGATYLLGSKVFPAVFANYPVTSINGYVTDDGGTPYGIAISSLVDAVGLVNINFYNHTPVAITRIVGFSWVAIGRWY